ncbi:MAG TPA: DUF1385 domain-containing protein [Thermoanaerobacterales bacterium]|nr:DUF1385 domain-containing protein [Thermoanaerobacterales bacterium]
MNNSNIGGQAVIEGVMMRSPQKTAIAVRKPDSEIFLYEEKTSSLANKYKFFKLPLIRGVLSLVESMVLGIRAISISADLSAQEEGEELTKKDMIIAFLTAVVFAVLLFIVIPTVTASFLKGYFSNIIYLNLAEGLIRIIIFLLYIVMISQMKDIQRIFEYHGAEHKVIYCYEMGEELKVENAKKYSTLHPRCGTNFLLIVMLISVLLFSVLGWQGIVERIVSRILLLPIVSGLSYEVIKYTARKQNVIVKIISYPGLMLQKLTTREPDESQLEVAIKALKGVL